MRAWIDKKNELCRLVKTISDWEGGDDFEWLSDYCKIIVLAYFENLDEPLNCFRNVEQQIFSRPKRTVGYERASGRCAKEI